MPQARLIAMDWGTSSLRAYLLGDGGAVESCQQPWGILHLPAGGLAAALQGVAGDWLAAMPELLVIASGMVGSAQGWREAACAACPGDTEALAGQLLPLRRAAPVSRCTSCPVCAAAASGRT